MVVVQDADLEYDPAELPKLVRPILDGKADVVYGSRFVGGDSHRVLYFWHSVGNRVLTLLSNVFTNLNLTDMETCYKVFRREIIQGITLEEDRFGFEPEVTAKIAALDRLPDLRGRNLVCRTNVCGRQEDRVARRRSSRVVHLEVSAWAAGCVRSEESRGKSERRRAAVQR